jgi:hypothetical protein
MNPLTAGLLVATLLAGLLVAWTVWQAWRAERHGPTPGPYPVPRAVQDAITAAYAAEDELYNARFHANTHRPRSHR